MILNMFTLLFDLHSCSVHRDSLSSKMSQVSHLLFTFAWPLAIVSTLLLTWTLLRPVLGVVVRDLGRRTLPSLPKGSPPHWSPHHLPLLGSAIPFFGRRQDMFLDGPGNFSFFVGRKQIVNVSGTVNGRRTFFENKSLSLGQGAVELLAGLVSANDNREDYGAQDFIKSFLALSRPEILGRKLPTLRDDIRHFDKLLGMSPVSESNPNWRIMNPFETIYPLMFKLIVRVVGVTEWLEDDKTLARVLWAFCGFENNCSRARIILPYLITLTHTKKLFFGAVLYMAIDKAIKKRRAGVVRHDDALQFLLDHDKDVVRFIFSVLMSGITTEGCTASWLVVFLAHSPEWQAKCRAEVDDVVVRHGGKKNPATPQDILDSLSLQELETEFPVLIATFREAIRLAMPGAMFRKNTSGKPVRIGGDETKIEVNVIPDGAYAAFHLDSVHMNPELYPDPMRFNPGRYLDDHEQKEQKQEQPHTYLGWGAGRHPCPGMRLAKLETTMVVIRLLASWELEPSDSTGNRVDIPFPAPDRNGYRMGKSAVPLWVRCRPRQG
ncbi:Cytochrome P450 [Rhypophila sp. PSN 637]